MPEPRVDDVTPAAARQVAANLFVLGFPLVLADVVRRTHPVASMRFRRLPADVAPMALGLGQDDPCILQTSAVADLSDGPAVLHLPDMRGRYFSLTLVDSGGEVFASLGTRTRDHVGADVVLAGPNWRGELAAGARAQRAPSDLVWAVSRIVSHGPADLANVEELAARQRVAPLIKPVDPGPSEKLAVLGGGELPWPQQVAALAPETLLHRLPQLVEGAPATLKARLRPTLMAELGRLAGRANAQTWTDELRQALARGFADGLARTLAAAEDEARTESSGWLAAAAPHLEATPLERAARTLLTLGGPAPEDVLTLVCDADESGRALAGDERYRVHFGAGGLPPAEGGWRLSAAANDGGAATGTVSDGTELTFNRDGSLELIIQADAPEAGRVINWLPTPAGRFRLAMRILWPREPALDGRWRMPPVERLGSRFARRSTARPKAARSPPQTDLSTAAPQWRTSP